MDNNPKEFLKALAKQENKPITDEQIENITKKYDGKWGDFLDNYSKSIGKPISPEQKETIITKYNLQSTGQKKKVSVEAGLEDSLGGIEEENQSIASHNTLRDKAQQIQDYRKAYETFSDEKVAAMGEEGLRLKEEPAVPPPMSLSDAIKADIDRVVESGYTQQLSPETSYTLDKYRNNLDETEGLLNGQIGVLDNYESQLKELIQSPKLQEYMGALESAAEFAVDLNPLREQLQALEMDIDKSVANGDVKKANQLIAQHGSLNSQFNQIVQNPEYRRIYGILNDKATSDKFREVEQLESKYEMIRANAEIVSKKYSAMVGDYNSLVKQANQAFAIVAQGGKPLGLASSEKETLTDVDEKLNRWLKTASEQDLPEGVKQELANADMTFDDFKDQWANVPKPITPNSVPMSSIEMYAKGIEEFTPIEIGGIKFDQTTRFLNTLVNTARAVAAAPTDLASGAIHLSALPDYGMGLMMSAAGVPDEIAFASMDKWKDQIAAWNYLGDKIQGRALQGFDVSELGQQGSLIENIGYFSGNAITAASHFAPTLVMGGVGGQITKSGGRVFPAIGNNIFIPQVIGMESRASLNTLMQNYEQGEMSDFEFYRKAQEHAPLLNNVFAGVAMGMLERFSYVGIEKQVSALRNAKGFLPNLGIMAASATDQALINWAEAGVSHINHKYAENVGKEELTEVQKVSKAFESGSSFLFSEEGLEAGAMAGLGSIVLGGFGKIKATRPNYVNVEGYGRMDAGVIAQVDKKGVSSLVETLDNISEFVANEKEAKMYSDYIKDRIKFLEGDATDAQLENVLNVERAMSNARKSYDIEQVKIEGENVMLVPVSGLKEEGSEKLFQNGLHGKMVVREFDDSNTAQLMADNLNNKLNGRLFEVVGYGDGKFGVIEKTHPLDALKDVTFDSKAQAEMRANELKEIYKEEEFTIKFDNEKGLYTIEVGVQEAEGEKVDSNIKPEKAGEVDEAPVTMEWDNVKNKIDESTEKEEPVLEKPQDGGNQKEGEKDSTELRTKEEKVRVTDDLADYGFKVTETPSLKNVKIVPVDKYNLSAKESSSVYESIDVNNEFDSWNKSPLKGAENISGGWFRLLKITDGKSVLHSPELNLTVVIDSNINDAIAVNDFISNNSVEALIERTNSKKQSNESTTEATEKQDVINDQKSEAEAEKELQEEAKTRIARVNVADINVDAKRFQFKQDLDAESGAAKDFVETKEFQEELAGTVSLWIDPADGKTYVINGHHRVALAKKSGAKQMNAIYIQAKTAAEARFIGAKQNIAEGKGTDVDAAKVIRENGLDLSDLKAAGLSLTDSKMRNGLALANLSDGLFNLVAMGKIPVGQGIIIGENISSHSIQEQFYDKVKGRNLTNQVLQVMAQDIEAAPRKTVKDDQLSMFGETEKELADIENQAKFISGIRSALSRAKNMLGKVAKSKDFLEKYGNKIDQQKSEGVSQESAEALAVFDALRRSQPISGIINRGLERINNGENRSKVEADAVKEIIEATKEILGGTAKKDGEGSTSTPKSEQPIAQPKKVTNKTGLVGVLRDLFGLSKQKADSAAVVSDIIIGNMAARQGISKKQMYELLSFMKARTSDLTGKGNALYQIIGENAQLAQNVRDNLQVARDMESAGKDAKTIRVATGWEKGADGKWRYEIMDSGFKAEFTESSINSKISQLKSENKRLEDEIEQIRSNSDNLRNELLAKVSSGELSPTKAQEQFSKSQKENRDKINENKKTIDVNNDKLFDLRLSSPRDSWSSFEEAMQEGRTFTLSEILTPELLEAYPQLKEMRVTFADRYVEGFENLLTDDTLAVYVERGNRGEIIVNTRNKGQSKENILSSLLHEIQHAIQDIEGFARGGNTTTANSIIQEEYIGLLDVIEKLSKERNITSEKIDKLANKNVKYLYERDNWNKVKNLFNEGALKEKDFKEITLAKDPIEYYKRLAGEVEARNVQSRMGMNAQQRRETTLQETEDVARDEQIVLFQGGSNNSARGAMMTLQDGQAIIYALENPNVSTPLHELAHVYEHYLTEAERSDILRWAKHKEWTTETSEKFARGFEAYLAKGKSPVASLQKHFDNFKKWLTDIYNGIMGSEIDIELNDDMTRIYDAMLTPVEQLQSKTRSQSKKSEQATEKANELVKQKPKQRQVAISAPGVKQRIDSMAAQLQKTFPNVDVVTDPKTVVDRAKQLGYSPNTLGFVADGVIYINSDRANEFTAVEEFAHLWVAIMEQTNKPLYRKALQLVKQTEAYNEVVEDAFYKDADTRDIEQEAIARVIRDFVGETQGQSRKDLNLVEKVWRFIRESLNSAFGWVIPKSSYTNISRLTLKDFLKLAKSELLDGIPLTTVNSAELGAMLESRVISSSFKIHGLLNTNPTKLGTFSAMLERFLYSSGNASRAAQNIKEDYEGGIQMSTRRLDIMHRRLFGEAIPQYFKDFGIDENAQAKTIEDIQSVFRGELRIDELPLQLQRFVGSYMNIKSKMQNEILAILGKEGKLVLNENLELLFIDNYKVESEYDALIAEVYEFRQAMERKILDSNADIKELMEELTMIEENSRSLLIYQEAMRIKALTDMIVEMKGDVSATEREIYNRTAELLLKAQTLSKTGKTKEQGLTDSEYKDAVAEAKKVRAEMKLLLADAKAMEVKSDDPIIQDRLKELAFVQETIDNLVENLEEGITRSDLLKKLNRVSGMKLKEHASSLSMNETMSVRYNLNDNGTFDLVLYQKNGKKVEAKEVSQDDIANAFPHGALTQMLGNASLSEIQGIDTYPPEKTTNNRVGYYELRGGQLLNGNKLQSAIKANDMKYVARFYLAHKIGNYRDYMEKLMGPEKYNKARKYIADVYQSRKIRSVRKEKVGDHYQYYFINEFGMESQPYIPKNLEKALTDLGMSLTDINAIKNKQSDGIIDLERLTGFHKNVPGEGTHVGFNMTDEFFNNIIDNILPNERTTNGETKGGTPRVDLSPLRKKKNLPEEVRMILGEVKQTDVLMTETLRLMNNITLGYEYAQNILNEMPDRVAYGNRPTGWVELGPAQMPFIVNRDKKVFMEPTLYQFLYGRENYSSTFMDILTSLSGFTKFSLTAANPGSHARNYVSGYKLLVRSGNAGAISFMPFAQAVVLGSAKDVRAMWQAMNVPMLATNALFVKGFSQMLPLIRNQKIADLIKEIAKKGEAGLVITDKDVDSIAEMIKNNDVLDEISLFFAEKGFFSGSPGVAHLEETLEIMSRGMLSPWGEQISDSPLLKAKKGLANEIKSISKVYQQGDAVFKIAMYLNEYNFYESKYAREGKENAAELADAKATEIVRNNFPNYGRSPEAFRVLSKSPFVGNFILFRTELVRNTYNTILLASQELKDADQKTKVKGASRIAQLSAAIPAYAVAGYLGTRLWRGFFPDDDEETFVKNGLPSYMINSNIMVKYLKGMEAKYWDYSYEDVDSEIISSFKAAARGDGKGTFYSLFGGFISPDISTKEVLRYFSYIADKDAVELRDELGRSVFTINDSPSRKFFNSVTHIGSVYTPRLLKEGADIFKGVGQKFEEMGLSDEEMARLQQKRRDLREYPIDIEGKITNLTIGRRTVTRDLSFGHRSKFNELGDQLNTRKRNLSAASTKNQVKTYFEGMDALVNESKDVFNGVVYLFREEKNPAKMNEQDELQAFKKAKDWFKDNVSGFNAALRKSLYREQMTNSSIKSIYMLNDDKMKSMEKSNPELYEYFNQLYLERLIVD